MADQSICKIEGCGKPHYGRGYCRSHYMRARRHGSPTLGRTPEGKPLEFLRRSIEHAGDACILWPYSKSSKGYAIIWSDGRLRSATRFVCEHHHGHPPTDQHEAAHSCGNGRRGCINKHHLSWKTPTENAADKIGHGTHARGSKVNGAKLSEEDVRKIRSLRGRLTQAKIAEMFGVSRALIGYIYSGRAWSWLA